MNQGICRLFPRYHLVRLKVTRKTRSGCENTSKAYKFFAEPGYLHNVKGNEFYQNVIKIPAVKLEYLRFLSYYL